MRKNIAALFLLFCSTTVMLAQTTTSSHLFYDFFQNNKKLKYPLAGGLNAPQFSEIDLNNDKIKDIFVFDRVGGVILTFVNNGTPNQTDYTFAPEYVNIFPKNLQNWVLLKDYNNDSIMDIFAYSDVIGVDGIIVYQGFYQNNRISFKRINFTHLFQYNVLPVISNRAYSNLYVTRDDIPAIDDIDGDGDLDIVTFEVGGGLVYLFNNQSIELGFKADSLRFELKDNCWGRFYESGLTNEVTLSKSANTCAQQFIPNILENRRHSGSTLLTYDKDNDGDKELILGDISFSNFNMLTNGGTRTQAFMNEQDSSFPKNSVPVNINYFPASFMLDVNNDGKRDFLAASNSANNSEDKIVAWLYRNTGTNQIPVFTFEGNDFLVGEMLDVGSGAHPALVDVNGDGLLDLVIGNFNQWTNLISRDSRLFYYKNTGTAKVPRFDLVDDNWLNFKQFSSQTYNFSPAFGDLDGDGDMDLLVGEDGGQLFFVENKAGANKAMQFATPIFPYKNIDVGQASIPFIFDVNKDNKADIIVGERNGNLNYLQNIGENGIPNFNADLTKLPNIENWGGVNTRQNGNFIGSSAPIVLNQGNKTALLVGTEAGNIQYYNVDGSVFFKNTNDFGNIKDGIQTHLAVGDLNDDGFYEMVVGNFRGGISIYSTNINTLNVDNEDVIFDEFSVKIFPNPTQYFVKIETAQPQTAQLRIYNLLGTMMESHIFNGSIFLETTHWTNGVYFLAFEVNGKNMVKKVIKTP